MNVLKGMCEFMLCCHGNYAFLMIALDSEPKTPPKTIFVDFP
jgi:hypothetical protein